MRNNEPTHEPEKLVFFGTSDQCESIYRLARSAGRDFRKCHTLGPKPGEVNTVIIENDVIFWFNGKSDKHSSHKVLASPAEVMLAINVDS